MECFHHFCSENLFQALETWRQ